MARTAHGIVDRNFSRELNVYVHTNYTAIQGANLSTVVVNLKKPGAVEKHP
jgi:hypothetical protein